MSRFLDLVTEEEPGFDVGWDIVSIELQNLLERVGVYSILEKPSIIFLFNCFFSVPHDI